MISFDNLTGPQPSDVLAGPIDLCSCRRSHNIVSRRRSGPMRVSVTTDSMNGASGSTAMEVDNEGEAVRKARRSNEEEVEEKEEPKRTALWPRNITHVEDLDKYGKPIEVYPRNGAREKTIGTWRVLEEVLIEDKLQEYCSRGEYCLEEGFTFNVVEMKFDEHLNVMGRVVEPRRGWVLLLRAGCGAVQVCEQVCEPRVRPQLCEQGSAHDD